MSVYQDEKTGRWYYNYQTAGKRHHGACKGCTTRREAERYEKELRRVADNVAKIETADALYEARRRELTGNAGLPLVNAFEMAMRKPRKRQPAESQMQSKRSVFADFVAFMQGEFPDVTELAAVSRSHAEAYISHIQTKGRYVVRNSYERDGKTIKRATRKVNGTAEDGSPVSIDASTVPAPRTQKLFLATCAEVFRLLADEAGIGRNPFDGINVAVDNAEARETFTVDELRRIHDNLDSFTRPLFTTAVYTGMREGDICTLRRDEVDLTNGVILHIQRKTGNKVEIPILPPLHNLIKDLPPVVNKYSDEYVFPELAEMYLTNRCGVSYRVKQFLERLGIRTTKIPKGRSRAVSVKDLHSCRHTFCYLAGVAGVPLATVQSIVGHMTPEMTKHYMAHATLKDKRSGMAALAGVLPFAPEITTDNGCGVAEEPERAELLYLVRTADIELVKKLLNAAKG